jgi:hypothetical protein
MGGSFEKTTPGPRKTMGGCLMADSQSPSVGDTVSGAKWGTDTAVIERIENGTAFFVGGGFWKLDHLIVIRKESNTHEQHGHDRS